MTRIAAALFAVATSATLLPAQTALDAGRLYADSLAAGETDTFTLDVPAAGRFVVGEADQRTVDVVVTVFRPDGQRLLRVDGPARGPEAFQFTADAAGRYRIEVAPFEEGAGRYTLRLARVEPIATSPADRVDQIMAPYAGDAVPGGVVAVVRDGELVFSEAYGMANLTHGVPFTVDTRTNIGSTSKQFTAFAIALLAERGDLSLDDDVREHLPELPVFDAPVTLRNLLTHTSGYREFLNAFALAGRRVDQGDYIGRDEIVDLVRRQPELQNQPGAEWNYNNTAFALLTLVVERVTGQPFPEWMEENVFGPLGMDDTVIRAHASQIIRNSSQGYAPAEGGGWRQVGDLSGAMGAGGIYTTVADLARWIDNFDEHRVGGPEVFEAMTTPFVLTDGDTTGYGLGLFIDEYRGLDRVQHGGADIAHRAQLTYFPALDAGVLALSNNPTFNAAARADDLVDLFLAERLAPEEEEGEPDAVAGAEFDPASYDADDFDAVAGRYALAAAPAFILRFFREGDSLYTQATGQPRVPIVPTSDSTFRLTVVEASVTFHGAADGHADSATLHQNGNHVAHRVDAEAWQPTADELEAYTGRYFSPELQTFYTVALDGDELVLQHRRFEEDLTLTPGSEVDAFTGGFPVATVRFTRGAAGEVTGLLAGSGRTRDVRFEKLEEDALPMR